jgi:hypothetical protein
MGWMWRASTAATILWTIVLVGTTATDATRWITGKTSQIAVSREATADAEFYAGSFVVYNGTINSAWHTHVVYFNGAASHGRLDGLSGGTVNPGTGAPTNGAMLGANNLGSANFHSGDMGEVIVISGARTTGELDILDGYIAHKWGVTLTSGHPYENAPPTVSDGFFYLGSGGLQIPRATPLHTLR